MKKRVVCMLLAGMVMGNCGSVLAAEVPDSSTILEQAQAAMEAQTSGTIGMSLSFIGDADANGVTGSVDLQGDMTMKVLSDEKKAGAEGSLSYIVESSEDGTESDSMDFKLYVDTDETGEYLNLYMYTEESGWQATRQEISGDVEDSNMISMLDYMVEDMGDTWRLSGDGSLLELMDANSLAAVDDDVMYMVSLFGSAITMHVDYTIDKDTELPKALHVDFNDSDLSGIETLLASAMSVSSEEDDSVAYIDLNLEDCSLDFTFSYNDVSTVVIPQEALDALALADDVVDYSGVDEGLLSEIEALPEDVIE